MTSLFCCRFFFALLFLSAAAANEDVAVKNNFVWLEFKTEAKLRIKSMRLQERLVWQYVPYTVWEEFASCQKSVADGRESFRRCF